MLPPVVGSADGDEMRQSLASSSRPSHEERARPRRRESLARTTRLHAHARRERVLKRGSMRFCLLVLSLIATAVLVTVAMFETLYYLLG